ncbi:MAG: phosphate uptake regulator PhoU, partial [Methanomassiliicoccaceae archaeon]|nr:phosphate uptake regulator PhoU [Methanomassiliicoccaceae archaeon]
DVRRVQITGGSSFMITLPKDWANSIGLNKNDTVGVQAQPDGSLLLCPKGVFPSNKHSTKVIDASHIRSREFFSRQLVGAYIAGHTTILVKSAEPMSNDVLATVNDFVQSAIGLEMIEADDSHVLIANLIEHDAIDTRKIVERMGLLVKNMIQDVHTAAFSGDHSMIKNMEQKDTEIDRIYWLTFRQYNIYQRDVPAPRKSGVSTHRMTACLFMSRVLEDLGDLAVGMARFIRGLKEVDHSGKVSRETYEISHKATELLSKVIKAWVDRDIELAEQCIIDAQDVTSEAQKALLVHATSGKVFAADEMILINTRRVAQHSKMVAEFTFDVAME